MITKLYPNQYSHAGRAIDEALGKLDIGYIDLMLLHHPGTNEVTAYREIEKAVEAGKVRSAGISCVVFRIASLTKGVKKGRIHLKR